MPSPFPGMDPYLESYWSDVHPQLIVHSSGRLQRQLRGSGLVSRIEERLIVESPHLGIRSIRGDVAISDRDPRAVDLPSSVAVAEPLILPSEVITQRSLKIIDSKGGDVVTVVEFLSPSNKVAGIGKTRYLQKQSECLSAGVNLVEIDLVRAGSHVIAYPFESLPPTHQTTYIACVHRANRNKAFEIYRIPLDQPLPTIGIPLRYEDVDITLDLQSVVDQTYVEGAYETINYSLPCLPPLTGTDAEFATKVLTKA